MNTQLENLKNFIQKYNKEALLPYEVGPLLYSPATNSKISETILSGRLGNHYSVALCLEDAIHENAVEYGEQQVISTFKTLFHHTVSSKLPKLFIRVKTPEQIKKLYHLLGDSVNILTGFIFPKYSLQNAEEYHSNFMEINALSNHPIYMMPILESGDIINLKDRHSTLYAIKELLQPIRSHVLNIRVGGNDFCHYFGIRRHFDETIYGIQAIASILGDIITVFSKDFVVSGPVWEYFSSQNDEWELGLRKEIKQDLLNGFIGKTVIHPNQVSVVADSLKVSKEDFHDAWDVLHCQNQMLQVEKSHSGQRMNEIKTHTNWAEKQLILSYLYGIQHEAERNQ